LILRHGDDQKSKQVFSLPGNEDKLIVMLERKDAA